MSSRRSNLSLNQKLTLLVGILAVIATIISAFISGHDWFSQKPSLSTETSTDLQNTNTPDTNFQIETSCIWKWEFNTNGDREGWQVNRWVNNLRVDGGALRGEFSQFDPSLLSPQQLNIDTSRYTVLSVGYQITSDDIDAQVMWNSQNDTNFSDGMQLLYGILTDGKWHTIEIQLGDDASWTTSPIINALRFDPVHNSISGTFAYDYIRICE